MVSKNKINIKKPKTNPIDKVFTSYKYRLYPNQLQKDLIFKHFNISRFIFNLILETRITAWKSNSRKSISEYDINSQIADLKKDLPWLKEVNSQVLNQVSKDLYQAFKGFFRGGGFPRFKSKYNSRDSFTVPQHVKIVEGKLQIPKFKTGINFKQHRRLKPNEVIKFCCVSQDKDGTFHVSITVDTNKPHPVKFKIKPEKSIGIDLGIKEFLTDSNGGIINNPNKNQDFIDLENKLKHLNQKLSIKRNKGLNLTRIKIQINKTNKKLRNKRMDFLHKLSYSMVKNQDIETIFIEDLNVKSMMSRKTGNSNLSKSISQVSWSQFILFLKYKADLNGVNVKTINRYEPSSKMCSCCGNVKANLSLKDRTYECMNCGLVLDRDLNAALNIKQLGLDGSDKENLLNPFVSKRSTGYRPKINHELSADSNLEKGMKTVEALTVEDTPL